MRDSVDCRRTRAGRDERRSTTSRRRAAAWAVGAGVASLCSLLPGCRPAPSRAEDSSPRGELTLVSGPLVVRHLMSGELEAAEAWQFITPNVGQWPLQIQRLLPNGAGVAAGDVVVEFDNSNLLTTLANQESTVIRAQADLESTRSLQAEQVREKELALQQKEAETEKARIAASLPPGLKAEIEYQKLQLELKRAELAGEEARASLASTRETAEAEIGIKEVELDRAWQDYRHAEQSLDQVVLRAPEDGILVVNYDRRQDRTFQSGDSAQPGEAVARLPNLETLQVRARLFDVDEGDLEDGATATVTLDAYPDRTFGARIREIQQVAQQPSRRSSRRAFDVLLDLDELDLELMLPGMSAKVVVEREVKLDRQGRATVLAPRAALALDADLLGPPTSPSAARAAERAELSFADGSTAEVVLGPCNAAHCVVEAAGADGVALRPGARLRAASR